LERPRRDTQEKAPTARGDQRFGTAAESRLLPTTTATIIIIIAVITIINNNNNNKRTTARKIGARKN